MITKDSSGTTLSASYISALTATDREYDAKILDNGTAINCSIDRLTITKGSCGDTNGFVIGSVVGSTLVANVRDLTDTVKGKELEVQIGLKVSGSFVYVTMGYFTVAEVQQTVYATTITAYGKVITKTGDAFTVPATTTLANVASSIATSVSALAGSTVTVTFDAGITTSDTITASMNGLTVYQALQVLASVCGGYAIDTNDGNIKICRFDDTATLSRNNDTMLNLPVVEETDFEITGVLCIVTPESEDDQGQVVPAVQYPATPLGTENLVVQNQYVTQTLYTNYLATLAGYEYRPATVGLTYGDPRLEGNDVLSITDINSNVYIVPCHMITHTYTGGFSTQVVAVNATPQENEVASSAGSLTEQLGSISANVISARTSAETAKAYAEIAKETTDEIVAYADTAGKTVTQILEDGETASQSAQEALTNAGIAYNSATQAINQLGVVEDIVGVLDLLANNGDYELTQDTEVQADKWYFESTADGYQVVISPTGDPNAQGWYELVGIDNAIQNYVSSHLVLAGNTLSLQNGNTRVSLSTTDGMTLYNEDGTPIASYGADAVIGDPSAFHITITPDYNNTGEGRLSFWRGSESNTDNEVAYVSGNKLYITQSVVLQQMDVGTKVADGGLGQWSWRVHPVTINGTSRNNLYLKWYG